MPTEKSGQHEFDFEYGDALRPAHRNLRSHVHQGAGALQSRGRPADNERQLARLKRLSDWLHEHDRLFMFEMLVPAEKAQLDAAGSQQAYDLKCGPG